MLGQLSVQRRLEHALRELVQQPSRADQAHSLFLRLREQSLREFLLIDDLPGHGINHRLVQQLGRVSHGHLLSDQTEPHTPLFRQSLLLIRCNHVASEAVKRSGSVFHSIV
jgi:hypothetical protein